MTPQERAEEWLKESYGYAQYAEYETASIIQDLLSELEEMKKNEADYLKIQRELVQELEQVKFDRNTKHDLAAEQIEELEMELEQVKFDRHKYIDLWGRQCKIAEELEKELEAAKKTDSTEWRNGMAYNRDY